MGWGTGNIGGGSGGLNFKIVGGTSEPSATRENTIWVNTNATISEYVFSAEKPASPVDGMVWIATGATSSVAFNALKKNGIFVYPNAVKQYVNGVWEKKDVLVYFKGEWTQLRKYYFDNGDQCKDVTGGWNDDNWTFGSNYGTDVPASIGNTMSISITNKDGNKITAVGTTNKVSLSDVNTLYINVSEATAVRFILSTTKSINSPLARLDINEAGVHAIDVSSMNNSYYIVVACVTYSSLAASSVTVKEVWGEV